MAGYDDRGSKQTSRQRQYRNQTARDRHDSGVECSISQAPHGRHVFPPINDHDNIRQSQTPIYPLLSARARSQNGVQRPQEKGLTLQLMEENKKQATSIEALKIEMKTTRIEMHRQARNHKRFENLATRKLENLETNLRREESEKTKILERLSTRIGNVELEHENLENKISSYHNEVKGFFNQNQIDIGYIKERVKHIPPHSLEDEDLNHDKNLKRKKNRNTDSKQESKEPFNPNF